MKITVFNNNIQTNEVDLSTLVVSGQESIFYLGRSEQCHVVIPSQKVSRQQCELKFDGIKWNIRSLSDHVIIYYNNQVLIGELNINSGDTLIVDDYIVNFEVLEQIKNTKIPPSIFEDEIVEKEELTDTQNFETEEISVDEDNDLTQHVAASGIDLPDPFGDSLEDEVENELMTNISDNSLDDEKEENLFENGFSEENSDNEFLEQDDSFALDNFDDAGEKTQVLKGFAKFSLELFGEYSPYDNYNIEAAEIFIGRDASKCQILLQDPEVSSVHAVIRKNNITCSIEDLQSANGTILNGKRINKVDITNGDEFIIGSTTFTVRVGSEFLDSQRGMLMPVEENQVVEVEEIVEVLDDDYEDSDDMLSGQEGLKAKKTGLVGIWKDDEKRKKLIYAIVGIIVAYVMFAPEVSNDEKKDKPKTEVSKTNEQAQSGEDVKLTEAQIIDLETAYQLGYSYLKENKYPEAINELDKVFKIKKDYKEARQYYQLAKDALAQLERIELEKREEEKRIIKKKKVEDLLQKAEVAVSERNVSLAEGLFAKIKELDPSNFDVTNLEMDLEAWKKEKAEKELAEAQRIAERKRMEDALIPGKTHYLKEEWYNAIGELEKFLVIKGTDSDLIESATQMLKESKDKLKEVVDPLVGKARSLKEGEDLKGAYAAYRDVLKYDPAFGEALNEMDDINFTITSRSRKIYREAIIAESLGLFEKAKEKYQEIIQITPEDNEYYEKSSDRLKDL